MQDAGLALHGRDKDLTILLRNIRFKELADIFHRLSVIRGLEIDHVAAHDLL